MTAREVWVINVLTNEVTGRGLEEMADVSEVFHRASSAKVVWFESTMVFDIHEPTSEASKEPSETTLAERLISAVGGAMARSADILVLLATTTTSPAENARNMKLS